MWQCVAVCCNGSWVWGLAQSRCIVECCSVLQCVLQYVAVFYSELQWQLGMGVGTEQLCCSVLQCVLQYVAVCCSVLQWQLGMGFGIEQVCWGVLEFVGVCWGVLQSVAMC